MVIYGYSMRPEPFRSLFEIIFICILGHGKLRAYLQSSQKMFFVVGSKQTSMVRIRKSLYGTVLFFLYGEWNMKYKYCCRCGFEFGSLQHKHQCLKNFIHPHSSKALERQQREQIRKRAKSKINGAKRRKLGFIPLNEPFEDSEAHHIDFECVVNIPRELHTSIRHNVWTGEGMFEINDRTFEWLIEYGQI